MGSFKLGKMTLRSLFSKPETVLYPFETRPVHENLKGIVENDMSLCILCSRCQKCCPTGAIVVDRAAQEWRIDRFSCVQCGSCVRECPKDSLSMAPEFPQASVSKSIVVLAKPEPTEEERAAEAAKKAAKVAAAKAAREAKAKAAAEAKPAE